MESSMQSEMDCFPLAFVNTTIHPLLKKRESSLPAPHGFITGLRIGPFLETQGLEVDPEYYPINKELALFVERNPMGIPICELKTFETLPPHWTTVEVEEGQHSKVGSKLAYLKSCASEKWQSMDSISIGEKTENNKGLENTQPSLTERSSHPKNIIIQIDGENYPICYGLKTLPKQEIVKTSCKIIAESESLFKSGSEVIDLNGISMFCFPDGIRVLRQSAGFRFVSFILTSKEGEHYYCNSIIFSEECSKDVTEALSNDYGIEPINGFLYHEKAFTICSEKNCTDQVNRCLEHFYKVYLTEPQEIFYKKIADLKKTFTIHRDSLKARFSVHGLDMEFKVNTSYPTVSNHAIYAVFKFLEIEQILQVMEGLLLQKKIFFVSDSNTIIGYAIQAFRSFIYPLYWIHVIVPFLNNEILDYAEAPMTIIAGVSPDLSAQCQQKAKDAVFVYLDESKIVRTSNENIHLKKNLRKQLGERLKQFSVYDRIDVRDFLQNPQNLSLFKTREIEDPDFNPLKIRNIFFQLLVYLLRDYKDYFLPLKQEEINEQAMSLKKFYDLKKLKLLHKKDPFMLQFFETSLFSELIDKKRLDPSHKWIKTLDRAIRKISKFEKHFIQQQSDNNHSEAEQIEQKGQYIPKGCINLFTLFSKDSDREKSSTHSSPSPRSKKISNPDQPENEKDSMQWRSTTDEKSDKETNGDKQSEKQIPELQQPKVSYKRQGEEGPQDQGVAHHICLFISYPYHRARDSVAGRWTRRKFQNFKDWVTKNQKQVKTTTMEEIKGQDQ